VKVYKRILVILALLTLCVTSGAVIGGEEGQKNTRNALGAVTVIEAVKGNKGAAIVGAGATLVAQHRLDKTIQRRHARAAARRRALARRHHKHVVHHVYRSR